MGGGVLVRGEGWCRRRCWRERAGVGRSRRTRFIWAIGGRSVGRRKGREKGGRGLPFARRKDREWKGVVARSEIHPV